MDELVKNSNNFKKDKELAFRFMLTNESTRCQELSEELNFYTN